MNNNLIIAIAVTAALIIGLPWLIKLRRVFIVPEGYAGLLYKKGKFVEVLRTGEHVRWGRKFTLGVNDLRKTSVVIPGQEVLSADNVGLKASLLVTYQVVDPAKANATAFQARVHDGPSGKYICERAVKVAELSPGYHSYLVGTMELGQYTRLWMGHSHNDAVKTVWFDRAILVPVK